MRIAKAINRREKYLMAIAAMDISVDDDVMNTEKIDEWLSLSIIDCDSGISGIVELAKKEFLKETDSIGDLLSIRADKYLLNEIK